MRRLLLIIALIAALPAAAETYKWVDEQGVVHYSDTPRPGAQQVDLHTRTPVSAATPGTGDAVAAATPDTAPESAADDKPPVEVVTGYRLEIASPANDEVLWNLGGNLSVSVSTRPALRKGDRVQLYYNGSPVGEPRPSTSFTVHDVIRGTHTLSATVLDARGAELGRSPTVTVHVKQTSVLFRH